MAAKAIKRARVDAFEDLGKEAIHEFELEDFPVTVAVDSKGRVDSPICGRDEWNDCRSRLSGRVGTRLTGTGCAGNGSSATKIDRKRAV